MSRINRHYLREHLPCALAVTLIIADARASAESASTSHATPTPKPDFLRYGAIYVDVITDKTGAVARLDFLNNVPVQVQEWVKKKTLGHHFGIPNHSYRRHIEYEVPESRSKKR